MTAAAAPGVQPSSTAVFRKPDFALLWLAQLVSTAGSSLTDLAAGILVYERTGSAFLVGATLMAAAIPTVLVGLIAGVFVDRWDKRRVMVVTSLVQAVAVALIPLLVGVHIAFLFAALLVNAGLRQFFDPAYESLIPEIATDDELAAANAYLSIASFGSTAIGFAGAGLLASALSVDWAFWIDAVTFLFAAACIALLRIRVPVAAEQEPTSVGLVAANLRVGLATIWHTPTLRSLFLVIAPAFFSFGLWNVLLLPMAIRELGATEFEYGIQEGVTSLGFVVGSLVMARWSDRLPTGTWIFVGALGMGLSGLAYAGSPVIWVAIVFAIISGGFNSPMSVARQTLLQRHTPRELRGRVVSALFAARDLVFLLGMACAGLADIVNVRVLLAFCAVLLLIVAAASLVAPGIGRPAAEWRRGLAALRAAEAAEAAAAEGEAEPPPLPARPATPADFDRLVARMPTFKRLSRAQRAGFIDAATVREVPADTRLVSRGETASTAAFILAGEAVAGIGDAGGWRVLSVMGPGEVFGEIAALTGSARTADVVAVEPTTLLEVPGQALRDVMVVPEISRLLLATLRERLLRTDQTDLPRIASLDQASLRELRTQAPPAEADAA
ncbi:MAG: MFS transporter [Chloroflexota bacterium]